MGEKKSYTQKVIWALLWSAVIFAGYGFITAIIEIFKQICDVILKIW